MLRNRSASGEASRLRRLEPSSERNARNRGAGHGHLSSNAAGGGGIMISVPSNRSITPFGEKSSLGHAELREEEAGRACTGCDARHAAMPTVA